jgi:arylsulfatase A-like enzyme
MTIRYPRQGRVGARVKEMALNLDLAPTMLDLAGVPVPKQMQGRSLLPLARGEKPEWRKDWVYEYYEFPEFERIRPHYGIRTERYKYIHYYFERDEYELYDLEQDPEEKHNLYGDSRYAELTQQLARRLAELRREYGDTGKYDVTPAYVAEGTKPGRA